MEKYKPRRFTQTEYEAMKTFRQLGMPYNQLAEKYGVAPSTMQYYLNEKYRQRERIRTRNWAKKHPEMIKEQRHKYQQTKEFKYAVAKSWLRKYLRDKTLTKQDVLNALNDYEIKRRTLWVATK